MFKFKIQINEQAAGRNDYIPMAYNLEDAIYCHCAYFLVFNMPQTENHWKSELYGFLKKIKRVTVRSGDKSEYTTIALVEMAHGGHFCEDKESPEDTFRMVYNSEDNPHPFYFNMDLPHNREVYFDAIDRFYYEFLIPWVSVPEKEPPKEPLYAAIDRYLIARREDMVSR